MGASDQHSQCVVVCFIEAGRRRILGRRWKRVVAACRESIGSASTPEVPPSRSFTLNIVKMLEEGDPEESQALAANLLDTMLRETSMDPLGGKSPISVTDCQSTTC